MIQFEYPSHFFEKLDFEKYERDVQRKFGNEDHIKLLHDFSEIHVSDLVRSTNWWNLLQTSLAIARKVSSKVDRCGIVLNSHTPYWVLQLANSLLPLSPSETRVFVSKEEAKEWLSRK